MPGGCRHLKRCGCGSGHKKQNKAAVTEGLTPELALSPVAFVYMLEAELAAVYWKRHRKGFR